MRTRLVLAPTNKTQPDGCRSLASHNIQSKITHKKGHHHHRTGTEAVGAGGALGKADGTATGTSSSDASLTNSATGADAGASDHASASAAPGERADASRAPDVAVAVHHLINRFDILEVSAGARFWDAMSAVAPPDALRNVPVRLRR